MIWPAVAGALLIILLFSELATHSLRDFSRSRLEEYCRLKGRPKRFGMILKRHNDVLVASELLSLLALLAIVMVVVSWLSLVPPTSHTAAAWSAYISELVVFAVVLLSAVVVIPWTVARVTGEKYVYFVWPALKTLLTVAHPLLRAVREVDKFVHRLSGLPQPKEGNAAVITEEIRTVVDEGQREGIIESEARTMIHRVIELQDEDASAIMTPRTDMVCIQVDSTLDEARERLLEAGHSRVPIIGESTDDIVGILYAKDLLKHMHAGNGQAMKLREIAREPFYVPETTGIDKLLETMKRKHVQMAIVVDEYGGVAGLVTMEDILEEIVGEIVDEYDRAQEEGIWPIDSEIIEVEARVHIDDLNERFGYELPEDGDFDTVGGFVFNQLGRIPEPSESLTWNKLRITVLDADKRKIHKLRIELDPTLAAAPAEES